MSLATTQVFKSMPDFKNKTIWAVLNRKQIVISITVARIDVWIK